MELENLIGLQSEHPKLLDFLRSPGESPQAFEIGADDHHESMVLVLKQTGLQSLFDKEHKVNRIYAFSGSVPRYG